MLRLYSHLICFSLNMGGCFINTSASTRVNTCCNVIDYYTQVLFTIDFIATQILQQLHLSSVHNSSSTLKQYLSV
jgi:hypothetical protein